MIFLQPRGRAGKLTTTSHRNTSYEGPRGYVHSADQWFSMSIARSTTGLFIFRVGQELE
jgi:hypothetical protein